MEYQEDASVDKIKALFLDELGGDNDEESNTSMQSEDIDLRNCHPSEYDLATGCIGTGLGKLHDGYFGKAAIAEVFRNAVMEIVHELPDEPVILGIGSGPGLPEIQVKRILEEVGKRPKLILSDKIGRAMKGHYKGFEPGENTEKKVFDNKRMQIGSESIDIVIARSSVHYEKTEAARLVVLREVQRVLKPGGVFLHQEHAISTQEEADFANMERGLVGKHSTHITTQRELEMHEMVFSEENVRLADVQPAPLYDDWKNFCKRFNLNDEAKKEEKERILKTIVAYIEPRLAQMPNVSLRDDENNKYHHITPFQLIIAKNKEL